MVGSSVSALGYIILLSTPKHSNKVVGIVAACLVAMGLSPIIVLAAMWSACNNIGYTYRASAVGWLNVLSQAFAISGNQAFSDAPYYHQGLAASLGMVCVSGLGAGALWVLLRWENAKKVAVDGESEQAREWRDRGIDEVGNKHPDFMFVY